MGMGLTFKSSLYLSAFKKKNYFHHKKKVLLQSYQNIAYLFLLCLGCLPWK